MKLSFTNLLLGPYEVYWYFIDGTITQLIFDQNSANVPERQRKREKKEKLKLKTYPKS